MRKLAVLRRNAAPRISGMFNKLKPHIELSPLEPRLHADNLGYQASVLFTNSGSGETAQ